MSNVDAISVNDAATQTGASLQDIQALLNGPDGKQILEAAQALFAASPQLFQTQTSPANLATAKNVAPQFSVSPQPLPWSQTVSGISPALVNDPAQLNASLSSASANLINGITSGPLGSFDAGSIDQQVNQLQNQAATDAANGKTALAQQEMTEAATLQEMASQILSILGSEIKDSIQNWKVQA